MSHIDALSAVAELDGLDVLDVGAGQGAFVSALCTKGARAVGVEIDHNAVDRAKAALGCDIRLGKAEDLPFGPASFDLLTYIFSFHHIPEAAHDAALAEAVRVLRPDGRIFVAEPMLEGDMTKIVAAIDDETTVRTAALNSLSTLPRKLGLRCTHLPEYTMTRHYTSFDDLLANLVAVDPARRERVERLENRDRMQHEFEQCCRQTKKGFAVDQQVRCMLFENAQS